LFTVFRYHSVYAKNFAWCKTPPFMAKFLHPQKRQRSFLGARNDIFHFSAPKNALFRNRLFSNHAL